MDHERIAGARPTRELAPALPATLVEKISSAAARRTCFFMIISALALRLAVMTFVYPERLNPARDHWKFGGEAGRIARSLVEGRGFSSPLFADTGPTAWLTPVFPSLLAGVFEIFGIYTRSSALAILTLGCIFSAVTCIPVFFIARRSFGEREALWAGWIWTFFPYSIFFAADFIWETTLATFLFALLFWMALELADTGELDWQSSASSRPKTATIFAANQLQIPRPSAFDSQARDDNLMKQLVWRWLAFGALCGVAALTEPALMSVFPLIALWMLLRLRKRFRFQPNLWFAPGAAAILAVLVITSPWFIRNARAFHKFVPLRDNLGFELYCGNNKDSWHWDPPGYHPSDNAEEWREYRTLGEANYVALKGREAVTFIRAHKALYAKQTLRRIVYLWTGYWSFARRYLAQEPFDPENIAFCTALTILALLGLRRLFRERGWRAAMPYIIALVFFPFVYYLTHPEDYYRRPLDPVFVVLAAACVATWARRRVRHESAPQHQSTPTVN